jgi:hypothetical protein
MPITFDNVDNVTDTLEQYGQAYADLPPTPESEIYVVSDSQLKRRKAIRVAILLGIIGVVTFLIYLKIKKK